MNAVARVHATRRALVAASIARAVLWGAAAALGTLAVLALPAVRGLSGAMGFVVALALGVVVAAVLFARDRRTLTLSRVTLWIEERAPTLRWALASAIDPTVATSPAAPRLERAIGAVRWEPDARTRALRALVAPAIAAAVAGLVLVGARFLPSSIPADAPTVATTGTPEPPGSPFAGLRVRVRPPAYARQPDVEIEGPRVVEALVGSALEIRGERRGVTATAGDSALAVRESGSGWLIATRIGERPTALRLRAGGEERLVAIIPRPDSTPVVRLVDPQRDTVLREPRGAIGLRAEARDDIGLVSLAFEYIVSSGEGESFQFRSGTLGATRPGARQAESRASLSLEGLQLKPGDLVHVRAVARDANPGGSPGASETRVLRVARAGEFDSVAVEAAPPPDVQANALSQRMLIQLTEALERRRPRIDRPTLVAEAARIGRDQTRLRKRVGEIVFTRLEEDSGEHEHAPGDGHDHEEPTGPVNADSVLAAAEAATGAGVGEMLEGHGDESPIVAINKPLLEAYNAMWEAERMLQQANPRAALPPMRRALAAIQRARNAERFYLRGRPPRVVVDVARVRMQGKEKGESSVRTPRDPVEAAAQTRRDRFLRALRLVESDAASAVDSLLLLRIDLLADAPAASAAIGEAAEAARAGRDATPALARARRLLDGEPSPAQPLSAWRGGGGQ